MSSHVEGIMRRRLGALAARECYRRANDAARLAAATADPEEKQDLLAVERRWLTLGRSVELEQTLENEVKKKLN
jgi:hypothetical protein